MFLDVGMAILVSVPICWHCYIGEWSLHVGIVILASAPRCWDCYTGESSYMLTLLYWRVIPYMLGLLYW